VADCAESGAVESCGILVYDIGTTSVKSAIFDGKGSPRVSASVSYKTTYPRPGWSEQDPDQFWEAAVKGTREILASPGAIPVEAVGLTGHMNGCLPVDAQGRATYPELIHSDSRSSSQCVRILAALGEDRLYAETGNRTDEHLSLPKMLWLKDERREAFNKTAWFLNSKDYLRFKLTGVLGVTDFSDASLTGAFNIGKREWSRDIIDCLDLSPARFPEVKRGIERGGALSKEAAALLGLPSGIPVSIGGGDAACATRGSGLTGGEPSASAQAGSGRAYVSVGSSAWASMLAPSPVFDTGRRIQNFFDLDGEQCNICGTVQSAGIALDWALGVLAGEALGPEQYRRIEEELDTLEPGSDGIMFLPYLMGERTPHWDAAARGVFVGLSLSSDRSHMLRSVYEGITFALKEIVDIYGDLHMPIETFTLLGGGIRSPFWRKLICDIIGIPMLIHPFPTHSIALGAAMAAGVSVGIWNNLNDAVGSVNFKTEEMFPDMEKSRNYGKFFTLYRNMYKHLKPVFDELAEARKTINGG
jgi:xylulokinase